MLEQIRHELVAKITQALVEMGITDAQVNLDVPPRRQLGDLAWAGALPLAKALRRPPRAIAEEVAAKVAAAIEATPGDHPLALVQPTPRVEGPGFVNFFLRRGPSLASLLTHANTPASPSPTAADKVIIEHTNINPNKAAHIGHLRNAVLGDTLVRCLRYTGKRVEVQDYIDDTGVQVADVVVGFLFLPELELLSAVTPVWPEVRQGEGSARQRVLAALLGREQAGTLTRDELATLDFDDLCWELYPLVGRHYETDPTFTAHRAEVLHAIEAGFPSDLSLAKAVDSLLSSEPSPRSPEPCSIARIAATVAEANLRCHLFTMGRLGIAYDVLPHESDILKRGFWTRAFELLQAADAIRLETEGKNAGCWVMSLVDSPEFAGMADADKILVRSNGTVTYTGKDIAYQLWKLGLLRDADGTVHDFGYTAFASFEQTEPAAAVEYGRGEHTLFRTSYDPKMQPGGSGAFGCGQKVYNVIDVRQSYPQKVVKEAIRILGFGDAADNSIHFAYEMVALTPKAVKRLEETQGIDFGLTDEDMKKPFVEMSGRRGIGVKADALLATLVQEAHAAIAARLGGGTSIPTADVARRAWAIAVGALRYQMAKQGRNRVLAFDFDEALAFEGDTGPYLQYSAVRARKVFDKLAEAGLAGTASDDIAAAAGMDVPDDLWELIFACSRTDEMAQKAIVALEFSLMAGHVRDLAQAFHKLYHEHPVLHAPDDATRVLRRAVFRLFAATITEILEGLLGIPVPTEM